MADEKKTMHSGWLETRDGELFAPKTIIDNITARDGKSYDSVIKEYISNVQGGNENSIATIERDIDALYEKIKNFDGTDSDTFYIIDGSSNVIARIDASGIHSVEVEAQGYKLTEMGKKLDYINTDDLTEFFIMDGSGNIIMRVDNNGVTSVDFHSRNGSLNDVATRMTAVEMDIEAKFKNLDTSDSNEFVVRDSAGNIIARIDANGVTSVNFDTPTTISYTELVALVNSNNLTNNAAVENLKAYVDDRLKNFNGDDDEIFYIVDNNDPKNAIFKVDASGATSVNFITKEADLNTVASNLKTEIKAREDAINAEETARIEKDKLIDTAIGQLQQADADFTTRLQYADFSDANTFYVIDKNNCIITRIDNEGTHSIDFIAYRDIEDGKESISLWALKDKVDENKTNIDKTLSSEIDRIEGVVEQNQAIFEGRKVNVGDELLGGGALKTDITISHKTSGVDATYSLTASEDISGSADSGDIHIPRITINEYGHVTNITNDSVKITMPDLAPLQQADAQFTEKLKFTDFSQSDALYIGDNDTEESNEDGSPKIKNLIAKIDETGVTSVDFTAIDKRDEENPKSVSLLGLQTKVDDNHISINTALTENVQTLNGKIETNKAIIDQHTGQITTLNANSTTEGSVAYQIAQVVAGAPASYDTLKEIADWIGNDTSGAASMANDISNIKKWIDEDLDAKGYTSRQAEQDDFIAKLQGSSVTASTQLEGSGNLTGENGASTKIEIKHSEVGPASGYIKNASTNNSTALISGSAQTGTIKIPQITVNKYGHITSAGTESVEIKMPDLGPLETVTGQLTSDLQFVDFADSDAIYIGDNVTDAKFEDGSWKPENLIAKINKDGITSIDFIALNTNEDKPASVSLLGLQKKVDDNQEAINDSLDTAVLNLTGKIDNNYATFTGRKINIGADKQLTGGGALANDITIGHAEMNNDANYKLTATADVSGSAKTTTVSIPSLTVNKYGHVTNIEDKTFKITMPDLAPLENILAGIKAQITGGDATSSEITISNNKLTISDLTLKTVNNNIGTYGMTTDQSPDFESSVNIPYFTVNGKGLITSAGHKTLTIPSLDPVNENIAGLSTQLAAIEQRFSYNDGDKIFSIVDGSNNIIARFDASGLTTTNVILHKEGSDSIDFQNNAVFFESTTNTITINNI